MAARTPATSPARLKLMASLSLPFDPASNLRPLLQMFPSEAMCQCAASRQAPAGPRRRAPGTQGARRCAWDKKFMGRKIHSPSRPIARTREREQDVNFMVETG
jgi:hypothetical protein